MPNVFHSSNIPGKKTSPGKALREWFEVVRGVQGRITSLQSNPFRRYIYLDLTHSFFQSMHISLWPLLRDIIKHLK